MEQVIIDDFTDVKTLRLKTKEEFIHDYGSKYTINVSSYRKLYEWYFGVPISLIDRQDVVNFITRLSAIDKKMVCRPYTAEEFAAAEKQIAYEKEILKKLEVKDKEGVYAIGTYKKSPTFTARFQIFNYPTGNCQVSSICSFDQLLNACTDEELLVILQHCKRQYYGKSLYIIDVRQQYEPRLKELFKFYVPLQQYVSTNNSLMALGLINVE